MTTETDTQGSVAAQESATGRRRRRSGGPPFLMAVPALLFFGFFALLPLGGVVVLSFMEWDGLGTPQWAGLSKWGQTLADPVTRQAMRSAERRGGKRRRDRGE